MSAEDLVCTINKDGVITEVSQAFAKCIGLTPTQIIGEKILTLVHPDDWEHTKTIVKSLFEQNTESTLVFENRILSNSKWAVFHWRMAKMGKKILARAKNVSNCSACQGDVFRYKEIVTKYKDGIIVFFNDGRIHQTNLSAQNLFGYENQELLGKQIHILFQGQCRELIDSILLDRKNATFELDGVCKNGKVIPVQFSVSSFVYHEQVNYIGTIIDIADKKAQDEERLLLIEKTEQANQAKNEFVAHISHELRTPMHAILGMAELLRSSSLNEEQRETVGHILSSGQGLLTIMNDLLDLSKIEAGKFVIEQLPFDLHITIQDCIENLAHAAKKKGLKFVLDYPESVNTNWVGDAGRVRQVLLNIIGNAAKFSKKGTITVHVQETKTGVQISVKDEGIGITHEQMQRLFQPFSQGDSSITRTYGGTGLGLTISKKLVSLMGGKMSVESEVGKGSTFSFTIKLLPDNQTKRSPIKGGKDINYVLFAGKNILVVEDHPTNQLIAKRILEKFACRVSLASHGQEALEILDREKFDLIFLDCEMPIMDGYETVRRIRSEEKVKCPVIALTAHAMAKDKEKCIQAGMDDFATKPMAVQMFSAILAKWL